MKCPFCHQADYDIVVDSRVGADGSSVRRRRECGRCHARFTTYERAVDTRVFSDQRAKAKRIAGELRDMAGTLENW